MINMNNEPPINPDMLKMNVIDSSREFDSDLWLFHASEDYVTTRILILSGMHRLGSYHMQQTVEKYIKAFILKQYGIDTKIIKGRKYNFIKGVQIKFETHNLTKLLEYCQKKDDFFKKDGVKTLINILVGFNEVRYPSEFTIDFTTGEPEIVFYLDYFVKKVRDLVNTNIKNDWIWKLQSLPLINLGEFGFFAGEELKDIGKFFFHGNNQFEHITKRDKKP